MSCDMREVCIYLYVLGCILHCTLSSYMLMYLQVIIETRIIR